MEAIPDIFIILASIGLAIALPWLIFLAADRNNRREVSNVWQNSLEAIRKTLRGETQELDELAQRVKQLNVENNEPSHTTQEKVI